MILAPTLLLAGCNLFQSGLITQTCEDLPAGCDGTIDTDPPTDDTDDTAPYIPDNPFTTGTVVASARDGELQMRVFDRDGELIQGASLSADAVAGPVAYDPATSRLFLWDNGASQLFVIGADGEPTQVPPSTTDGDVGMVFDAQVIETALYVSTANAVWVYQPDTSNLRKVGTVTGMVQVQSLFEAFDDNLFLLNWGSDDTPDLYRFTISTGESRLSYEAFDDSLGRSASGFQGPVAKPWVCSSVGGFYAVEDLQGGDRAPSAFPDADDISDLLGVTVLSGVTDCEWDDNAERYLLHSKDHGVFTMDEWGRLEVLITPEANEGFVRGYFFDDPDTDTE